MDLDFLGELPAETPKAAETPAPEPTEQPQPEPAPEPTPEGPARGADGKFVAKAGEAPQPTEAAPAAPVAVAAQPQEETELVKLRAQVEGLQKAIGEARQQKREAQLPPPDLYEDPEGFQAWSVQQQSSERADWSRKLAVATNGGDFMGQVQEWAAARAEQDPMFRQMTWTHPDPYGFAVEKYREHQALTMLSDPKTLERFQAFMSGSVPAAGAEQQPVVQQQQAAIPPPVAPPRSITAAASAGGVSHTPQGPGSAFASAIQ